MSKGIAADIKSIFRNATTLLSHLNPQVGETMPIKLENRMIYFSIIKNKYFHEPKIKDIKTSIDKLKLTMIKHQDHKLAIPTIATGLDKCS